MNKQGSVLIYGMMIGLVVIILGLALSSPVQEFISDSMSSLDCDSTSNTNFIKAACIATDLTLFYFIAAILFIGGTLIGARIVFSN